MAASDKKVKEIIQSTLTKHAAKPQGCNRNWAAVKDLYNRRNNPSDPNSSLDENLAMAEHYMYARACVSCGIYSLTQMRLMVLSYYAAKKTIPEKMLRHNPKKPVTPASREQITWGLAGAEAGEQDRKKHGAGDKPPLYKKPPNFVGAR